MIKLRVCELFAGIGGFRLGIEQALERHDTSFVFVSEWDKYAAQIYNKNFRHEATQGQDCESLHGMVSKSECHDVQGAIYGVDTRDITTVRTEEIPDHDLLVGGFPCQAFSIAGKRRGFDDTRGTLFFEIARILKDKQPKYFILENVKGLLSHDNGNTFKTIITTLTELGYDLQWQVLNSKNFGVPQNRERVFIVGHLRGEPRPEVFPIGDGSEGDNEKQLQREEASKSYGTGFNLENWRGHPLPKVRRLTPTECERLQGFPDDWTENGLSSIMEICVNMNPAIESQLLKSGIAYSTTKDGNVMELLNYPRGLKSNVSIVVEEPLPANSAIDTISRGNDMVMLYSQNETLRDVEEIKRNLTLEETGGKSTKMLLNLYLEGSWNEAKLSTILTLIKETIASPTSMFAKIDENIIGAIIHLKKQESNSLKEASFVLRMASISPISDTQRYKCLGNAVTVNVVQHIVNRIFNVEDAE